MRRLFYLFAATTMVLSACDASMNNPEDSWQLSRSRLEFGYESENQYISIANGSEELEFSITSDVDWCSAYTDGYNLFVSVQRNDLLDVRNAVISVECGGKKVEVEILQGFEEDASGLETSVMLPFFDSEVSVGKLSGTDEIKLIVDADWLRYRVKDREVVVYTDTTYYGREERSTNVIVMCGEKRNDVQVVQEANPLDVDITYELQTDLTESAHGVIFHLEMSAEASDIRFMCINNGIELYDVEDDRILFSFLEGAGYTYKDYMGQGFNFLFYKQMSYRVAYYVLDDLGHNGPLESFYIYSSDFYGGEYGKWIDDWSLACSAGTGDVTADIKIIAAEAGISYKLDGWNSITMAQTGGICVNLTFDEESSEAVFVGGMVGTVEIDGVSGELYFFPIDDSGNHIECSAGADLAHLVMLSDGEAEIAPSDDSYKGMAFFFKPEGGDYEPVVAPSSMWKFPMTLKNKGKQNIQQFQVPTWEK